VRGIEDLVKAAYADGKLFSELGVSWSQKTNPINLASIKNTDIIGYFMS
jgi:hypothetical protein